MSTEPLVMVRYAIVQSRDRPVVCDRSECRAARSLPWHERTARAKLVWDKRHTARVADICRKRTPQV